MRHKVGTAQLLIDAEHESHHATDGQAQSAPARPGGRCCCANPQKPRLEQADTEWSRTKSEDKEFRLSGID